MIDVLKNGLVRFSVAENTGLPIYDYRLSLNPGHHSDLCTKKDLELLGIELTDHQKGFNIRAFEIDKNYRGAMPLYSLKEFLHK